MRKLTADLIQETTATAGTGTLALALVTGWARFSDRFAANDPALYMIENGVNKEVGLGTVLAGNQLARTTILGTIVGGVANWSSPTAITLAGTSTVRAVASEWLLNSFVRAEFQTVTTSQGIVDGGRYAVANNSVVLTLPASPQVNDSIHIIQALAGITGTVIAPNGGNICGVAGNMTVDLDSFDFWLVYTGATYGWRLA